MSLEKLKAFSNDLISVMEKELFAIRLEWPKPEIWSKKSSLVVKAYLDKLKIYIIENPFKRRSEEVHFFKEIKPVFMGKYIFYIGVYNIEVDRLDCTDIDEELFLLEKESEVHIRNFFLHNDDSYTYYLDQRKDIDNKLFVRDVDDPFTFRGFYNKMYPVAAYGDPIFSTSFDYLFAQFKGYEQLNDYLETEIAALRLVGKEIPREVIKFTGTSGDFVELVNIFMSVAEPTDTETGEPASEELVAALLKEMFNADWGDVEDFATLKLICDNSDLPERMVEVLKDMIKKWEAEEGDQEYDSNDK